ncbi:hypothetical protein WL48_23515 [Burkholderia ubonensis]|nr:hypothetical protein WL48_23515 [Burkholderia ubonensis]
MRVRRIQIKKITGLLSAQVFKHLEGFKQRDKRSGRQPDLVCFGKRINQRLSMDAERLMFLRRGGIDSAFHLSFSGGKPPRINVQEFGREQQIRPLHLLCLPAQPVADRRGSHSARPCQIRSPFFGRQLHCLFQAFG